MKDTVRNPSLSCDLCQLRVERDFPIHTRARTLHFCCEGCQGIYRMLHQPEELPEGSVKEQENE